jgi:hypothetical protein
VADSHDIKSITGRYLSESDKEFDDTLMVEGEGERQSERKRDRGRERARERQRQREQAIETERASE